ncbi:DNA-binding domain-containing protein [Spectribacter hydrogenooxidans]|uniref:DNA-binding domain-containing protein n=1 Tax=Spectribacter hydrogenoxidans TaxID=3075608 RepID=A0ABU3C2F1_9GAMM|nr:putative DNA-binding domain-containing protein [Salinisphaera sp. W335]MDT0635738.1 putative DNA-binding domain-containing protein [Salinisphaera sp. W335]
MSNAVLGSDSLPRFQQLQYDFTAHIRNPAGAPAPDDVAAERMAVYKRLVYNNLEGYFSNAFPVLRAYYADADWHALVREFFVNHHCHKPQFFQAAEEFLAFLQNEHQPRPVDPPFMLELAHYEWVEMMLYVLDVEPDMAGVDPNGDLLDGAPMISPLVYNLAYQYPVHDIDPADPPTEAPAQPTCLVVYRDRTREERVHFLKINPVTARLLQLIESEPERSGREHLAVIAAEMQHPQPDAVIEGGAATLVDLRHRDILLGCRPVAG